MLLDDSQKDVDFWNFWESNKKLFFGKCLKLTNGDVYEAEDALSASMLKVWERALHCRDSIQNLTGWALRITENICLDQLRKHKRFIRYDDVPELISHKEYEQGDLFLESAEKYNSREELIRQLFESMFKLPQRLREVALLRFLFFEPYYRIAGQLNISEMNARKRVQQTKSILKIQFGSKTDGLLSLCPGQDSMEPESQVIDEIRTNARSMLANNRFELEQSHISAWIVKVSTSAGSHTEILAFLPFKNAGNAKAVESSLQYLAKHPGGWKKHIELAQILYVTGFWEQSEDILLHVLKKNPRACSACMVLGNILVESGRPEEAERLFRQTSFQVLYDSSKCYLNGMAAMCRGELSEAEALFELASNLEPSNIFFHHAKGIRLFRSGKYHESLQLFKKLIIGNPKDIISLAYCCEISILLGRSEEAGEYLENILAENPYDFYGLTRKIGLNSSKGLPAVEEQRRLYRKKRKLGQLGTVIQNIKK